MGLFNDTLIDIYEASKKNRFTEAKKILDKHIEAEHNFQSDLSGLQGALNSYSHELRQLQEESTYLLSRKAANAKALQELFKDKTYNARIHLVKIEALIMRLRQNARIELK